MSLETDDEHILRIRIYPGHPRCYVSSEVVQEVLREGLLSEDVSGTQEAYSSLFLGRLIDYPWLSYYLATSAYNDPKWRKSTGKPVSMDMYKYVSSVLSRREFVEQFENLFPAHRYAVRSVTVEKILIGTFHDVPLYKGKMAAQGKIPFDAMVWLRLMKR